MKFLDYNGFEYDIKCVFPGIGRWWLAFDNEDAVAIQAPSIAAVAATGLRGPVEAIISAKPMEPRLFWKDGTICAEDGIVFDVIEHLHDDPDPELAGLVVNFIKDHIKNHIKE